MRRFEGICAAPQGAWDDLFEYVDDVTRREVFALHEEVAMASSSATLLLPRRFVSEVLVVRDADDDLAGFGTVPVVTLPTQLRTV